MASSTSAGARPGTEEETTADVVRHDFLMLRICNWSSVVYILLGLTGFVVFAGFWPPPGPDLSAGEIAGYFREHRTGIGIGMVLQAMAGPFYFVWSAVISKIISRIEGPMGPLSVIELLGGLLTGLVTFVPAIAWLTAAFRADTSSDATIQTFYDFGWLFFDVTFVCSALQAVALGLAVQRDRRATSLFPAWVAWLCYLTAATYFPLALMPFFLTGPLAWNGLLSFWAVFVLFFVMTVVVTRYAFSALRMLEREMTGGARTS
jgi:hypothetical protein